MLKYLIDIKTTGVCSNSVCVCTMYVCMYVCMNMYMYVHVCLYVYGSACVCVCVYTFVHVWCVCLCACVWCARGWHLMSFSLVLHFVILKDGLTGLGAH